MFRIESNAIQLKLEIVRVDSLLMHEEVITQAAAKLLLEFKNLANLQNPIIVDENNIVLDGNHRAYAFARLNFRYIPVCRIDYFNPKAKLRFWYRQFGRIERLDILTRIIEEKGGRVQKMESAEALNRLRACDCYVCGLQYRGDYYCLRLPSHAVEDAVCAYSTLREIENAVRDLNVELTYIPCKYVADTGFCQSVGEDDVVLWTPRITKRMVVAAAKNHQVFAPKTTRHLIPARPLNVDVPSLWLRERISLADIDQRFQRHLESKKIRRFPPGQVLNGRYYEEELFVFY